MASSRFPSDLHHISKGAYRFTILIKSRTVACKCSSHRRVAQVYPNAFRLDDRLISTSLSPKLLRLQRTLLLRSMSDSVELTSGEAHSDVILQVSILQFFKTKYVTLVPGKLRSRKFPLHSLAVRGLEEGPI